MKTGCLPHSLYVKLQFKFVGVYPGITNIGTYPNLFWNILTRALYFCKFRKFHLGAWGPSNNSFLNTFGRKNKGWVILITAHHEGRRPIRTSIYYAELYNKVLNLIKFPSEDEKQKKQKKKHWKSFIIVLTLPL